MKILPFLALSCCALVSSLAEEVVFQRGLEHYEGVVDGMLKGADETSRSHSFWKGAHLDASGTPSGGNASMVLLRFDGIFKTGAGRIPPGATIISARLELYKTGEPADSGQYEQEEPSSRFLHLYEMLTPFQAGHPDVESDLYACFWYRSYGGDRPEYWGNANRLENGPVREIDYNPHPVARIALEPGSIDQWYEVDLTDLVGRWAAGSTENHGLYLVARGYWIGAHFASSQHPDPALRPKLTIEYGK